MADPTTGNRLSDLEIRLLAENSDLRHWISILSAQLTTLQASITSQFGGLSAQVVNLSQKMAKLAAGARAGAASATATKTCHSLGRVTPGDVKVRLRRAR